MYAILYVLKNVPEIYEENFALMDSKVTRLDVSVDFEALILELKIVKLFQSVNHLNRYFT